MKATPLIAAIAGLLLSAQANAGTLTYSIGWVVSGTPLQTTTGTIGTGRYAQTGADVWAPNSMSSLASATASWAIALTWSGSGTPPAAVNASWHKVDKAGFSWNLESSNFNTPANGQETGRGKSNAVDTGLITINQLTNAAQNGNNNQSSGSLPGSIAPAAPSWTLSGGVYTASITAVALTSLSADATFTRPMYSFARKEDWAYAWGAEEFYIDSVTY